MADGRLAKDVQYLHRHLESLSNGQVKITDVDDNLDYLKLDILPNDGYYKGAKISFKMEFSEIVYPDEVPKVLCLDRVFHPNIDPDADEDNVCVSLLEDWDSSMGLDHIIVALLFLMYNPNVGDALSGYFDSDYQESEELLKSDIRRTLRGCELQGVEWPRLLIGEDDETDESNCSNDGACQTSTDGVNETVDNGRDMENNNSVSGGEVMDTSPSSTDLYSATVYTDSNEPTPAGSSNDETKLAKTVSDSEVAFNFRNAVLSSASLTLDLQDVPVISMDLDGTSVDSKSTGTATKCADGAFCMGRLFCCSSRIKFLFSVFRREDVGFQASGCTPVSENKDCDVD